jgi:hypothetical protein
MVVLLFILLHQQSWKCIGSYNAHTTIMDPSMHGSIGGPTIERFLFLVGLVAVDGYLLLLLGSNNQFKKHSHQMIRFLYSYE